MTTKTKEKTTNWQEAFKLREDLVQKDVYAFENALRMLEKLSVSVDTVLERAFQFINRAGHNMHQSIEAEHHLKAAIVARWLESPEAEIAEMSLNGTGRKSTRYFLDGVDIDEMHPGKVRWYAVQVVDLYNAITAIPDPNS